MCLSNLGWSANFFSTPMVLTRYSPKPSFPAWLFIMSYSSYELSNMLWLFFSLTGWLENPQRSKMAAETLPLKILMRVRACHCQCAAIWMFMACPYFTNTVVNKISSQVQVQSRVVIKTCIPKALRTTHPGSLEKDTERKTRHCFTIMQDLYSTVLLTLTP